MGSSDSSTTCTKGSSSSSKARRACNCSKCLRDDILRSARLAQSHADIVLRGMEQYTRRIEHKKTKKKRKKNGTAQMTKEANDNGKDDEDKDKGKDDEDKNDEKGGGCGGTEVTAVVA